MCDETVDKEVHRPCESPGRGFTPFPGYYFHENLVFYLEIPESKLYLPGLVRIGKQFEQVLFENYICGQNGEKQETSRHGYPHPSLMCRKEPVYGEKNYRHFPLPSRIRFLNILADIVYGSEPGIVSYLHVKLLLKGKTHKQV